MNNFFINLVRDVSSILNKKEKRTALLMLFYTYLNSLLDVISLALLLPLIKLCMDQTITEKNRVLRYIYTNLHFTSAVNFTFFILVVTLILFIAKMCLSVFINTAINRYTFNIAYRLTETNFNILYNLGLNEYNAVNSSIFFREIRNTPPVFASTVVLIIFQLIAESFVLILLLVGLAFADVTVLAMFIIVIVPFLALLYSATKRRVEQLGKKIWDVDASTFKFMNESILGFIDIILLNKKNYFIDKYMELTEKTNRLNLKKNIYNSIPAKVTEIVAILGLLIIYVYSSYVVHNSTTTLVTLLTVFAIASYRMLPSINKVLLNVLTLRNNAYIVKEIKDYLEQFTSYSTSATDAVKQVDIQFNTAIELKGISFRYPDKEAFSISHLDVKINKGEKIGFVGKSGSGKTTIINLLLRFLIEEKGDVMVDGCKLIPENLVSWRKKIGYVQQSIYILDATLRENIAFGDEKIDDSKLRRVIQLSQLSELVDSWKDGVETMLGENGSLISGGQKQRIGIARALYRNAEILLLDEATSALDMQTEKEISATISNLMVENITVIIVAHRITTLETCDRIYEMENGAIGRVYNYSELLNEKLNLKNVKQ